MMNMHSKYDNMHMNEMFYALIWINNHLIISITCMLLNVVHKMLAFVKAKNLFLVNIVSKKIVNLTSARWKCGKPYMFNLMCQLSISPCIKRIMINGWSFEMVHLWHLKLSMQPLMPWKKILTITTLLPSHATSWIFMGIIPPMLHLDFFFLII